MGQTKLLQAQYLGWLIFRQLNAMRKMLLQVESYYHWQYVRKDLELSRQILRIGQVRAKSMRGNGIRRQAQGNRSLQLFEVKGERVKGCTPPAPNKSFFYPFPPFGLDHSCK